MIRPPDLRELRDFIRSRRAALFGFMEQGAALQLDGDILRIIPRNDVYVRCLDDNRAVIAELATEFYRRPIEVVVQCEAPNSAAARNGSNPAIPDAIQTVQSNGHAKADRPKASLNGSTLPYAIAYARRGIGVFPVHDIERDHQCSCGRLDCPSGGKHPRLRDWQTLASTDEVQIAQWWREWPHANVGVKCGAGSNLTVLDVDGEEGRETLRALELECGELPETPVAITGSGGAHYYFAFEEGLQNKVKFAPGLDIRNEGGLVVGVGSKTKRKYEWEAAFALGNELLPARMPRWLADLVRAANAPAANGVRLILPAQIPTGERNNWLYKLARSLKARGMSAATITLAVQSENSTRCVPPMPDDEVRQLVDHATTEADQKGFVPPVQNGAGPAVRDDYADRQAIDAYDAFQNMVGEGREYSWEALIRVGCTAVLSALIGAGKTTLAMNLARAWGLGLSLFGRLCRQSRTLVVVSPKEYEAWADTIGFWELKGLVFLVKSTAAHFDDRAKTVNWFDYTMKKHECRTFVLDTLFDFFGMPPNTSGDANRIVMNEQTPLLELVRERGYSGLVLGHAPKSEAKAIDPRDPEEAFGGHTAWTAQHRMRMTIRRKSQGVNAFVTGRGGYGDQGILKEELLLFDEETRLVSLGGSFSEHLGRVAMPSVIEVLRDLGEPTSFRKIVEAMGKGDRWVKAGIKAGRNAHLIDTDAVKGKRNSTYWLLEQVLETGKLL